MKKVKAITNYEGKKLKLEDMEILFVGADWVLAQYKGYGFMKRYAPCDGYTVEFEEENA